MERNALGAAVTVSGVILLAAAMAETVPQDSPEKYYFTTPLHPGGIKGIVMGDPPAYRVMRSEDIDWLREAAAERAALLNGAGPEKIRRYLVPEFGKWPITAKNGWEKWTTAVFMENESIVTNIIARYAYRTNDLSGSLRMIKRESVMRTGRDEAIESETRKYGDVRKTVLTGLGIEDPEGKTIGDGFVARGEEAWESVTNVTEIAVTNWNGKASRTNETYITMPMTNGTVSVHTNRWVEILPAVESVTVTNIAEKTLEGMIFTSGTVAMYEPESPGLLEGLFRTKGIRDWYEVLKKAKYGCYDGNGKPGAEDVEWYGRFWPKDEYTSENTTTNTMKKGAWGQKSLTAWRAVYKGVEEKYEDYELKDLVPKEPEVSISGSMDEMYGQGPYVIYTDLPYEIAHTGGVGRIDTATLFAYVYVWFGRNWRIKGGNASSPYAYDEEGYTNKYYTVAKKIGEVTEIPEGVEVVAFGATNRYVGFSCSISMRELLEGAARAAGHAFPSYGYGPPLEKECPEAYIDTSPADPYYWNAVNGSSQVNETYSASMDSALLLIEFKPWTSLEGW